VRIVHVIAANFTAASAQSPAPLAVVNAASYVAQISPGSIATALGTNLPTDSNTTVNICTSACASFQNDYGLVPLELQTIAASDPTNAPGGTGTLVNLLPLALGLHTQIFEVYIQDLQVAYDPTSPDYTQYSNAYQTVFQQTASKLGMAVAK
jgi:hypothetical protein